MWKASILCKRFVTKIGRKEGGREGREMGGEGRAGEGREVGGRAGQLDLKVLCELLVQPFLPRAHYRRA